MNTLAGGEAICTTACVGFHREERSEWPACDSIKERPVQNRPSIGVMAIGDVDLYASNGVCSFGFLRVNPSRLNADRTGRDQSPSVAVTRADGTHNDATHEVTTITRPSGEPSAAGRVNF